MEVGLEEDPEAKRANIRDSHHALRSQLGSAPVVSYAISRDQIFLPLLGATCVRGMLSTCSEHCPALLNSWYCRTHPAQKLPALCFQSGEVGGPQQS